jgi:2-polyprenyl-3-methyl-5-hydroxy-6-metoxy-1,4-benzoquinol methylase
MPKDYFGERIAERYDETAADMFDPSVVDPVVDFLADLAFDGTALELGIGTGRIALPLAQRGIRIHGIDLSEAMVARLRAKPGAEQINVSIGDFATDYGAGTILSRLPGLQHDHESNDAGRTGRLLSERRRTPGARRPLRD